MTSASSPTSTRGPSRFGLTLLALALVTAALIGTRDITSEASVSLQGDMPRYLMNGVFLRDVLAEGPKWPPSAAMAYAERYYARYPALSIGHHPPLLPVSLVPFFALLGISVASARLAIVTYYLLSVGLLFRLVRRTYEATTAGWATLLFASLPFVGWYGQRVLSEMPAMALVLATMNAVVRFRRSGRVADYFLVVACATLSLAARQLAIFVFPAYVVMMLRDGGWRHFRRTPILICTAIGGALVGIAGIATLAYSPYNVAVVRHVFSNALGLADAGGAVRLIVQQQIGVPLLVLVALGVSSSIVARDRRLIDSLAWIGAVMAGVFFVTGPIEPERYSALAVPAYCIIGASLWCRTPKRTLHLAWAVVLLATFGWQIVSARDARPIGASGYEQAATYVLGERPGPTVLFSGSVDTGYFVFFVRKHDPAQRLVVLRSDKMLTTSLMGDVSVENNISSPDEIYPILRRFGTKFIVIEDHPTGSKVLDWLRDELRTPHFAERRRFSVASADRRLKNIDIVVYEYLEATPADPGAELDLHLPLVSREIRVPLSALGQP